MGTAQKHPSAQRRRVIPAGYYSTRSTESATCLTIEFFYLCKRILDPQVTEFATVLEVFAEENRAAGLLGRSDDEGVVPRESTMAVEAQCLGIESGRGVYR
jgi:hypothetical protein